MAKLNKKNTIDVFAGLKHVDKLLNEAASVGNPPKKQLSFEDRMKLKLKEGVDKAEESNEEELNEYNYHYPQSGSQQEGADSYLGEDDEFDYDLDDEFGDDEFGDEFGASEDMFSRAGGAAKRAATQDLEDEFPAEEEDEFDFTEDAELMEALMMEDDADIDAPENTEIPPVDSAAEIPAPVEATPTTGAEGEMGEPGAEIGVEDPAAAGAEIPGEEGAIDPMAGAPDLGGAAMGGGAAPTPTGMEEPGMDMATSGVSEPEDIDQLIADLVAGTGAEEEPAMFGENAHKDLGYTDLKDQDINSNKVTMKESEIKMTKLGDEDITGNVKGALTTGKAVKHSGTGKRNDPKGEEYTDLGDEDVTANKVGKAAEKATAPSQPKFASLQKENEQKTQALYTLAEKVITLEDEIANLKFNKFKLEKVNSVLTLLPELQLATREKLVEKFDSCKSYAETKKLYFEVASMVKEHKRGSINEAVNKRKGSSVKYLGENVEESNSVEDREQARKNFLMGMGDDDSYGVY